MKRSPILFLFALLIINVLLAFFLIAVLIDGIVNYKFVFILGVPVLVVLLGVLAYAFVNFFRRNVRETQKGFAIALFALLGLLNLFFYIFSVLVWLELFDGKTDILLP